MLENRIRDFIVLPAFSPAVAGFAPAFVACPVAVFAGASFPQQSMIAEVYRRAQELTEAQLRKPARRPTPEFSRN